MRSAQEAILGLARIVRGSGDAPVASSLRSKDPRNQRCTAIQKERAAEGNTDIGKAATHG